MRVAPVSQLENLIPVRRMRHVTDLPDIQGKNDLIEFRGHDAARKKSQIAALRRVFAFRIGFRNLFERFPAPNLLQRSLRGLFFIRQNLAGADLRGIIVFVLAPLVILRDFLRRNGNHGLHVEVNELFQQQIFALRRFPFRIRLPLFLQNLLQIGFVVFLPNVLQKRLKFLV